MQYARVLFLFMITISLWTIHAEAKSFIGGFDVTDTLIPLKQILPGGPPKDGIPSIDRPAFIPAPKADHLEGGDPVLGLVFKGQAKAYPIAIMNWHEIVNDRFGDQAVAVTFCPLCGTGIAFNSEVNERPLSFGVSGLLYNSDMLLYDRHTESLWSQIRMQAISGKYKGTQLQPIALDHTTWADWHRRHPETLVLSEDTGFARDYDKSPYGNYETSTSIYFPVEFTAKGYHPKERVLGIKVGDAVKAYPFAELAKTSGVIDDTLGGELLTIKYDGDNQTARVMNEEGTVVPSVIAYWFAWYTFHPVTSVFRVVHD